MCAHAKSKQAEYQFYSPWNKNIIKTVKSAQEHRKLWNNRDVRKRWVFVQNPSVYSEEDSPAFIGLIGTSRVMNLHKLQVQRLQKTQTRTLQTNTERDAVGFSLTLVKTQDNK